ncbi:MAG: hypothetical protein Q9168_005024 [Polycauliona sp. 1 TL-2023]
MRLSSPRFAYLKVIDEILFAHLRFRASDPDAVVLERASRERIGAYVKTITFEPPTEISTREKERLCNARLRAVWTGMLQAVSGLQTVSFGSIDSHPSNAPSQPQQLDGTESTEAEMGDALIAAAVACLGSAGTRMSRLRIDCQITRTQAWANLPGWNGLDLTKLNNVYYRPPDDYEHRVLFSDVEEATKAAQSAQAAENVSAMLKKCQSSVQWLRIHGDTRVTPSRGPNVFCLPIIWPGEDVVRLPRLQYLQLYFAHVLSRNLGGWLRHMPLLKYLDLAAGYSEDGDDVTVWLHVFDAIRDHPRNKAGIRIMFQRSPLDTGVSRSLDFQTDDYDKELSWYRDVQQGRVEYHPWRDAAKYVMLYMVGQVSDDDGVRCALV